MTAVLSLLVEEKCQQKLKFFVQRTTSRKFEDVELSATYIFCLSIRTETNVSLKGYKATWKQRTQQGGLAATFDLAAFRKVMIAPVKKSVNHSKTVTSMREMRRIHVILSVGDSTVENAFALSHCYFTVSMLFCGSTKFEHCD